MLKGIVGYMSSLLLSMRIACLTEVKYVFKQYRVKQLTKKILKLKMRDWIMLLPRMRFKRD